MKKAEFDEIIKRNLIKHIGKDVFGYVLSKNYGLYYNETEFDFFKKEMKEKYQFAFSQYAGGKGSELKEGVYPPKMASVASSSRFCYLALRNGGKAIGSDELPQFEVGCEITGIDGIPPQLDAYFLNTNLYVEAKCHEIFDKHKPIFKEKYHDLLCGENNDFEFPVKKKDSSEDFEIPLQTFGIDKVGSMFDIKQLVCHLLGISSQKKRELPATLLYLFFIPTTDNFETAEKIKHTFTELQNEIMCIFDSKPINNFTQKHNIRLLAVAQYAEIMQDLTEENMLYLYK